METEYIVIIGAFIASAVLGWVLYVNAYVSHRNGKKEEYYRNAIEDKILGINPSGEKEIGTAKTESWFLGYKLALVTLIVVGTALGYLVAWIIGGEYEMTVVESVIASVTGAIIGGFLFDRFVLHPVADGQFFERVEVPITENFLQNGVAVLPEKVKEPRLSRKKKELEAIIPEPKEPADPVKALTFSEKVKLIEELRKSL